MTDEKKPIIWMILFGVVRHLLGIVGAWLASRGLIDDDTHKRLVSEGAMQVVGYLLMAIPIVWSILQKKQAWGWVQTALRLDSRHTLAGNIPSVSPGPTMPM